LVAVNEETHENLSQDSWSLDWGLEKLRFWVLGG
jgi:hypothetical protein